MLCTPLPFVRLEPLLAPKFHLSISFAAAQALQRTLGVSLRGSSFLLHYEKKKEGSSASFFLFL
jgi:hypothetical protein